MGNTPMQHWVQPGRQASHGPLRRALAASALSTILTSSRSRAGGARERILLPKDSASVQLGVAEMKFAIYIGVVAIADYSFCRCGSGPTPARCRSNNSFTQ